MTCTDTVVIDRMRISSSLHVASESFDLPKKDVMMEFVAKKRLLFIYSDDSG
jgi:hypothetical protein